MVNRIIFRTLSGASYPVNIGANDTLYDVKIKVARAAGFDSSRTRLFVEPRVKLEGDDESFNSLARNFNMHDDAVVYAVEMLQSRPVAKRQLNGGHESKSKDRRLRFKSKKSAKKSKRSGKKKIKRSGKRSGKTGKKKSAKKAKKSGAKRSIRK